MQSIANLAAIGLERARGQEATARAEAARESSELRATVLDALAHEFKTPLTSMKAAAGDLLARLRDRDPTHELAVIINEDLDRLQALVTDAVQMLRIDAGRLRRCTAERQPARGLVAATLREFEQRLDGHSLVRPRARGSDVSTPTASCFGLALRQLLDNALKYSPPTSRIEIHADGERRRVASPCGTPARPFPSASRRGSSSASTAARRRAQSPAPAWAWPSSGRLREAHGGSIAVSSTPDAGTAFTLSLPRGVAP